MDGRVVLSPPMSALRGLILVSVSLGLSNFAAAIGIGISGSDRRTRIKTAIAFGLFEAVMPLSDCLLENTWPDLLAALVSTPGRGY